MWTMFDSFLWLIGMCVFWFGVVWVGMFLIGMAAMLLGMFTDTWGR